MNDTAIADQVFELLAKRRPEATICPSEVARALATPDDEESWRSAMPSVRRVAARLAADGRLRVTRGGVPVADAEDAGGPIRLGRPLDASD